MISKKNMNHITYYIVFLSSLLSIVVAQPIVYKVEINKCLDYNFNDDLFLENPADLDEIQEEFYLQNSTLDPTKFTHDGSVYKNANATTSYIYDRINRSYIVDDGEKNKKIFFLKFIENTLHNPKQVLVVEVTYFRTRTPPNLTGEILDGCLDDSNKEKYDLSKVSLINAFINVPPDERTLVFSLYRSYNDMILNQNMIPEVEWKDYSINSNDEHKVYLRISFKDTTKRCISESVINLQLKDYSTQMEQTEFEFCGNPFIISGPEDQQNYQWYYGGELKSSDQSVEINALGEWIVYFDNDLGCRSSVKVNIVSEKERARIEKVTATSNTITIIPLPNANIDSYSLDGVNYQTSGTFYNQTADVINIWYKTKLGCVFGPIPFEIANSFNFLSPNGDGINDTWNLRNKEFYKSAQIQIFDRYGKVIANGIVNDILPWSGKHNNFILPSGTYWFIIKDDKETLKSGYIILKSK